MTATATLPDLSVALCGVKLANPFLLASGVIGANAGGLLAAARAGAGAVVAKSVSRLPRPGHRGPCFIEPAPGVFLNAMGLNNPGAEAFAAELTEALRGPAPVVGSVFAENPEDFAAVARIVAGSGVSLLEADVSCPHANAKSGGGFGGQDPGFVRESIRAVKEAVGIPVLAKLTPNVTAIATIAAAALEGGADGLVAINTLQALEIDPFFERPVLGNGFGGQSGPSIRCIALRKVADIVLAMRGGGIRTAPVVGVGGIRTGLDAARFILAGATAVEIGSAVYDDDLAVFETAVGELKQFMQGKGHRTLDDFRGKALSWLEGKGGAP